MSPFRVNMLIKRSLMSICPMYYDKIDMINRQSIVALDPGEKIFMSYYSLNNCGHMLIKRKPSPILTLSGDILVMVYEKNYYFIKQR